MNTLIEKLRFKGHFCVININQAFLKTKLRVDDSNRYSSVCV